MEGSGSDGEGFLQVQGLEPGLGRGMGFVGLSLAPP